MGDMNVIPVTKNILLLWIVMVLVACDQLKDIDCDKISIVVAAGVEKNSGLDSNDEKLALHLRDTVMKTGAFHSYDHVQKACQKIKYDPNYRF